MQADTTNTQVTAIPKRKMVRTNMQNTDVKTKSKVKKILLSVLCIVISLCVLLVTFGGSLGIPSWNDVFVFCGIYADLGDDFSASFVNVGTADACCIRCHGSNILVDTGTSMSYEKLSAYLRRNDFESFDAVIISHPDSDHIGGMSEIIEDFTVEEIYMTSLPDNLIPVTDAYTEFENSVKENKIKVTYPAVGSTVQIGDMSLKFLSPTKSYNSTNDNSLVFRLTYGENSILFTGDISADVEEDLLNSNTELKSDVLKVAHHGSKTSSSAEFLKAVDPEISIVSVGMSDDGLPDYNTMARINNYSKSLYGTNTDKTIVITSDGKNLSVQTDA